MKYVECCKFKCNTHKWLHNRHQCLLSFNFRTGIIFCLGFLPAYNKLNISSFINIYLLYERTDDHLGVICAIFVNPFGLL